MNLDKNAIKETLLNFIVPLISLLVAGMLFMLVIRPSMAELPTLKAEVTTQQELKMQLQTKLSDLKKLQDFQTAVEENALLAEDVLAKAPMVPELLTQIHTIASESGLSVDRLSYSFSVGAEEVTADTVQSVAVSLGVNGAYAQLVAFMNNLENAARVVNVDSFRYSSDEDEGTLAISVSLSSPYLDVESSAVTDTPVNVDVTAAEFVDFMAKMKTLRLYQPTVDTSIVLVETSEEDELSVEDDTTGIGETNP